MTVQVKFTYEDYLLFPDDGRRHELIDGEHHVTPSPSERHQRITLNLACSIVDHLKLHPAGRLYTAPFDVILSSFDVVQPDLVFISSAKARSSPRTTFKEHLISSSRSSQRAPARPTKSSSGSSTSGMGCRSTGSWTLNWRQ